MKVAIVGYGVEGKASFDYWNRSGNELTIVDEREELENVPKGVATLLGADVFSRLTDFDLIIRSPSVNPKKLSYPGKVWSATNEFFAKCPAPIIGVTGTKGKGTTSSLIASILRAAGKTVHLVGNIGTSALEELPKITAEDIVVFELSSFQLWDIEKSPHIAVVLGIEPDHLDIHGDMAEYIAAKANITLHQDENDLLVYNKNNDIAVGIAENSRAKKIVYPFDMSAYADALVIPGRHNIENAAAAIAAAREYVQDGAIIRQGLSSFTGLPHRLELVRELDGVAYYDDSFSSAVPATKVAVASFTRPIILIAGGFDRGLDYTELSKAINETQNIKKVLLIGQTKSAIARHLREDSYELFDTLDTVVERAHDIAESGDVVLLSPGCASFDMFANFTERGKRFQEAVNKL